MLREELRRQRIFLSSDEEAALARPLSYQNDDDLAFDRVRGRAAWFQPMLRNRFIRDGRPVARWREYILADEAAAGGERTVISHLARQVLEWAARTSDRGAMFGGFVARTFRWIGLILALFGLYSWSTGERLGAGILFTVVAVLLLASWAVARLAVARTALLTEQLLAGAPPDGGDGPSEADTPSPNGALSA